jgi:hypothetical protein
MLILGRIAAVGAAQDVANAPNVGIKAGLGGEFSGISVGTV